MKSVAVICEYNPFHNGHAHQLSEIKKLCPDACIICLMSPNFVQRGEAAFFDKYTRADSAILSGANLVLSLPFVFSVLSAEGFAEAGVELAHSLGIDALAFGGEEDSLEVLEKIAELQLSSDFKKRVEEKCTLFPSLSLQKAGEQIIGELLGKRYSDAVSLPNNILALEYLKAVKRAGSSIKPILIKRVGEGYKSLNDAPFASATFIRKKLEEKEAFDAYVPSRCAQIYKKQIADGIFCDRKKLDMLIRANILKCEPDIERHFGNRELASRVLKAVKSSSSFDEALSKATTTRFTKSRIARSALGALFDIDHNAFMHSRPEYTQVLAMSDMGREFLSQKRSAAHPIIITKNADYTKHSHVLDFTKQFELEMKADEIWALACKSAVAPDTFMKISPKLF